MFKSIKLKKQAGFPPPASKDSCANPKGSAYSRQDRDQRLDDQFPNLLLLHNGKIYWV